MKLFITGISGLLGANLALQARDAWEVHGCYWLHPVGGEGIHAFRADVTERDALSRHLEAIRPQVIIHTAGLTNVDACEADPVRAHCLHVEGSRNVAAAADRMGAQLVHLSTDHLFDGTQPMVPEETPAAPVNAYARTKWQGEQEVLQACPGALIIRTNFFGWGPPHRASLSDWILAGLRAHRPLAMFTNVFFTPILINDLADAIFRLLTTGAKGTFHVAGNDRLSKYDFALALAGTFGLASNGIQAASVQASGLRARRPGDMSLSSAKAARHLGQAMPPVTQGLSRLVALEQRGWRDALHHFSSAR